MRSSRSTGVGFSFLSSSPKSRTSICIRQFPDADNKSCFLPTCVSVESMDRRTTTFAHQALSLVHHLAFLKPGRWVRSTAFASPVTSRVTLHRLPPACLAVLRLQPDRRDKLASRSAHDPHALTRRPSGRQTLRSGRRTKLIKSVGII